MAADLNKQNFAQAQAAATGDINRTLTADQSNQTAQQNKINSDILASQGLNTTARQLRGSWRRTLSACRTPPARSRWRKPKNDINAQMSKWQEAWNDPTKQLGVVQSALGMTPYGQTTTGQSNTQTYTPTDWAALAGSGMGMLGSIFAGKSDKRLKKNLKKVGESTNRACRSTITTGRARSQALRRRAGRWRRTWRRTFFPSAVHKDADDTLSVDLPVLGALCRNLRLSRARAARWGQAD